MTRRLLILIFFLLSPIKAGAATITGRDLEGKNIICGPGNTADNSISCSPNDTLIGVFTNVGLFQINAGTTVFVTPGIQLVMFASTISISGLLNGSGRGEVGGIGGDTDLPGSDGEGIGSGKGASASKGGGGAGYGNIGGIGSGGASSGTAYGLPGLESSPISPNDIAMGSGGGGGGGASGQTSGSGGQGGASIYLEVSSFTLLGGTISVRGVPGGNSATPAGAGGGGSGGSLLLRCMDSATVNGNINATGGKGGDVAGFAGGDTVYPGGGAGGGRVKIYYKQAAFSVDISTAGGVKGALAGFGVEGTPNAQAGSSGTVSFGIVASSHTNLTFSAIFVSSITWSWTATTNWGNADESSRKYRLYSDTTSYRTPDRSPQLATSSDTVSVTEKGLVPNTTYTRYATAFTDYSDSLPSNSVSTHTLASTPGAAASTFTAVSTASLSLNWSAGEPANPGYTKYEVNRSTDINFSINVSTSYSTVLSSTPVGLTPNTTYHFRIRAINLDNLPTDFTPRVSTATLAVKPTTPSFTDVSSTSFIFNWSGADNPPLTRYIADISTDNFATLVQSSITPNTSAVFTGLTPNALYYARARAQNHNGIDTDFTATVDTVTASATPLNTSVPFTNLSANTFTFNWKSGGNSAGTNYGPEISTDNFVTLYSSLTTTSLNADFSGLLVNTTYYARVSAIGSGGLASPYSSPVVSTVTLVLTPVTATPPFKDVFISSFTFLWENGGNPNGTLYTAEISTDGFVSVSSAIQTIATSANFSALTVNMVYQARTKAINFLGVDGPYSSPIRSTSTLATIPSNVSQPFSAVSASTLTFTWADGGNPGGTSYTVEISSTNFAQGTAISSATTLALSQTFSGLLPNTTYYGRVKAVNMNNVPSAYSPAVSVVTLPLAPVTASPPFSGVESSGLVLSWTANGNPQNTTYVAEISRDNFVTTPLSSTTLNTQASFTDLIPNTTYTARVKAVNFAGNSGPYSSPIVSTATLAVPPQSAVSSFTLTNDGLIVHWSAGGNPSGTLYEAEVSTRSDFTPLRSSSSVTSLSESFALTANTTYYARVRALNHNGIRTADLNLGSDITYAATPDVLASTTPGSVSVTTFSFTNTVSTGVGGILYYRFVWDKNATHAWNNQESSWTALNVLTTTATGNGHWYLHLRSYNFNNIGYKTADIGSFDIDINTVTAPGQPVPVPGAFTADSGITWNWATAIAFGDTAISSYVVCLGTAPTDVNVIVATVTPTNFTLDPADNGKTYYIKVKAIDEGGKSSPYSEVSNPGVLVDRTPPEQVGNVQADRKFSYDGTIVFSWSASEDAESGIKAYLLDMGTTLNGSDILNGKNMGLNLSYQSTGLPSGKSIFARVSAENNAGGISHYSDSSPGVPVWTLNQAPPMVKPYNWPNPFNPMSGPAQIGFFLNASAKVTLKLFTLEGDLVYEETRIENSAGNKVWSWGGRNGIRKMVAPGGYICIIEKYYTHKTEKQQFKLAVLY